MDPKNFRMRSSCLIDTSLLVDFSADSYARSLYGKLNLTGVKHIIITHSHADHLYAADLFAVRPPFALHNRNSPLYVYGNASVGKALERVGVPEKELGKYLQFVRFEAYRSYSVDGYEITPLPAAHDPSQECFIYVVRKNGKTLLYGHDSGYFHEDTWKALKNYIFDGVILDCTSGLEECPYSSHMGLPDNIRVKERMIREGMANDQTKFVLTHFAHTFGPFYDRMEKAATERGFIAAYDGMEMEI